MPADTPAHLSFDIVKRIAMFRESEATQDAGAVAQHLAHAHVLELGAGAPWDEADPTPLAESPAGLSGALIAALFDPKTLMDLVEASRDPIPGRMATEPQVEPESKHPNLTSRMSPSWGQTIGPHQKLAAPRR